MRTCASNQEFIKRRTGYGEDTPQFPDDAKNVLLYATINTTMSGIARARMKVERYRRAQSIRRFFRMSAKICLTSKFMMANSRLWKGHSRKGAYEKISRLRHQFICPRTFRCMDRSVKECMREYAGYAANVNVTGSVNITDFGSLASVPRGDDRCTAHEGEDQRSD